VGIPLARSLSAQNESILRAESASIRIEEASFEPVTARPRNLRDAVQTIIPSKLLSALPRSLDVVGDIAIVEFSPELEPYSAEIGTGILQVNPHVRLVLKKTSDVAGVHRTRELQILAGFGGMETVHREFGCSYRVNVGTVYFNPRLGHERRRVAKQVSARDVVVDMFAGVGPYSILIAKLQPHAKVYALDINPSAVRYLKENVLANRVTDRVIPLLGDTRQLAESSIHATADHVIMNLPSLAENFLDAASHILNVGGGFIHFYCFAQRGVNLNAVKEQFRKSLLGQKREVRSFTYCDVIREISPTRVQVAVDVLIK
jgi:tRNA (guanine37-N1)-methyltransferase